MSHLIGKWHRRALETRRSPYRVGQMVCTVCTATRQAKGFKGFVRVRPCEVWQNGLVRPGVQCPRCGMLWIEAEDQPEKVIP